MGTRISSQNRKSAVDAKKLQKNAKKTPKNAKKTPKNAKKTPKNASENVRKRQKTRPILKSDFGSKSLYHPCRKLHLAAGARAQVAASLVEVYRGLDREGIIC